MASPFAQRDASLELKRSASTALHRAKTLGSAALHRTAAGRAAGGGDDHDAAAGRPVVAEESEAGRKRAKATAFRLCFHCFPYSGQCLTLRSSAGGGCCCCRTGGFCNRLSSAFLQRDDMFLDELFRHY